MAPGPRGWGTRRLALWPLRVLARYGQWRGHYDALTESRFLEVWRRSGDPADLLQFLQFRRERGRPPTPSQITALQACLQSLTGGALRAAVERLLEADAVPIGRRDELAALVQPWAAQSPPIAAWLSQSEGVELALPDRRLADWHRQQPALRASLARALRVPSTGVCVVGNAASLHGAGLGRRIDRHGVVVRFNRYRSDATDPSDLGQRLDVWVCAPKFLGEALAMTPGRPDADWLVLSGPDVRYHRAGAALDWGAVAALLDVGVQVVTVPLEVWGGLIDRLAAPPSAGLVALAWFHELLGNWRPITIAGFGGGLPNTGRYHHASRRVRPGRRHDWAAERALLADWQQQGLQQMASQSEQ